MAVSYLLGLLLETRTRPGWPSLLLTPEWRLLVVFASHREHPQFTQLSIKVFCENFEAIEESQPID